MRRRGCSFRGWRGSSGFGTTYGYNTDGSLIVPPGGGTITLGTFSLFRGLAEAFTGGTKAYTGFPDSFLALGNNFFLGVPVQAWIFAAQDQSLRIILVEGKASTAPRTAAMVNEIVSYLASRGNPSFLDLDN